MAAVSISVSFAAASAAGLSFSVPAGACSGFFSPHPTMISIEIASNTLLKSVLSNSGCMHRDVSTVILIFFPFRLEPQHILEKRQPGLLDFGPMGVWLWKLGKPRKIGPDGRQQSGAFTVLVLC